MKMDEVIAKIEWTVEDIYNAFIDEFKREPTEKELENVVNDINKEGLEEVGIEKGWDSINSFMSDDAHKIIESLNREPNKEFYEKLISDFEISQNKIDQVISEIKESNLKINNNELKEEIAFRLIEETVDMHGFNSQFDGLHEIDVETNSKVMEAHSVILEEATNGYVHDYVKFDALQDFVDNRLLENGLYRSLEEKGILTDFLKIQEPELSTEIMSVYSFEPFGYDGSLVLVEADARRGIPAVDIVGFADSEIKDLRERTRNGILNSGLDYPPERVLISLSPADLRKSGKYHDLAVATAILNTERKYHSEPALVMGEVDISGTVYPVNAMRAAVSTALENGIKNIICHPDNVNEIKDFDGIKVFSCKNLFELEELFKNVRSFEEPEISSSVKAEKENKNVQFSQDSLVNIDESFLTGYSKTCEAIEAAVAGKHNLFLEGSPESGKSVLAEELIPYLTPKLTYEESLQKTRIESLAGKSVSKPVGCELAPFIKPEENYSIERFYGGGTHCKPGAISLANKGTLFLDKANNYKASALQMLRVPLERESITLSRAGRTTIYPANFQLVMTSQGCPCGGLHSPSAKCMDSKKTIELYNKNIESLVQRSEIKNLVVKDASDKKQISLSKMRERIENAYKIQRERGTYNSNLTPLQLKELINFTPEMNDYIAKQFPEQDINIINAMKVSLTVANMDGRTQVTLKDFKKAVELGNSIEKQSKNMKLKLEREQKSEKLREGR